MRITQYAYYAVYVLRSIRITQYTYYAVYVLRGIRITQYTYYVLCLIFSDPNASFEIKPQRKQSVMKVGKNTLRVMDGLMQYSILEVFHFTI